MDTGKGKFLSGVAIMIGLIVLGAMLPVAVNKYSESLRTVSVRGLCEREVTADKAIWQIKYKVVGNDLIDVNAEIDTKNSTVLAFLKDGGLNADEISVAVPAVSDKYAQEYGSNDRTYRFVVTNTITVCSKQIDKVLALMSTQTELLKKGITIENEWGSQPSFYFEALNDIKPEMIEEATKNAREVAEKFAHDSGSRLGKIKTASQGVFSIEDRDSSTPSQKKVRVVTSVTYYLSR